MGKRWVLVEEEGPTVPRLAHDLGGFVTYVNAVHDHHAKLALERFVAIINEQGQQEHPLKETENET